MVATGSASQLRSLDRLVFAFLALLNKLSEDLDRHSIVDPRVAEAIAQLLPDESEQFAGARRESAPPGTRVVGDGVENIHIPVVRRIEDSTPAVQLGVGGNHPVLDRHRLSARSNLELIAESQDPISRLGQGSLVGFGDIKEREVVHFIDLHESGVQLRLGNDHLCVQAAAVG